MNAKKNVLSQVNEVTERPVELLDFYYFLTNQITDDAESERIYQKAIDPSFEKYIGYVEALLKEYEGREAEVEIIFKSINQKEIYVKNNSLEFESAFDVKNMMPAVEFGILLDKLILKYRSTELLALRDDLVKDYEDLWEHLSLGRELESFQRSIYEVNREEMKISHVYYGDHLLLSPTAEAEIYRCLQIEFAELNRKYIDSNESVDASNSSILQLIFLFIKRHIDFWNSSRQTMYEFLKMMVMLCVDAICASSEHNDDKSFSDTSPPYMTYNDHMKGRGVVKERLNRLRHNVWGSPGFKREYLAQIISKGDIYHRRE